MADVASATPHYTMGFGEPILQLLKRHTAQTQSAYLLPHLRPGLRVLDFGCGPGTISVGLAEAIEPGELHGVDMESTQIDLARAIADAGGHGNASFHVGDVTELPFDDEYFDVVHGHAILTHVPDTQAALAEVKRVLKPGGLIAVREAIFRCSFLAPDFEILDDAWATLSELVVADDGHPDMGRHLKARLIEAGFTDLRPTASFSSYTTAEDVAFFQGIVNDWFLSPEVREAATEYGVVSHRQFDNLERAIKRWIRHPGAFAAVAHGECIASKPSA